MKRQHLHQDWKPGVAPGKILRLCQAKGERSLDTQGLASCWHERPGDGKGKWRGSQTESETEVMGGTVRDGTTGLLPSALLYGSPISGVELRGVFCVCETSFCFTSTWST